MAYDIQTAQRLVEAAAMSGARYTIAMLSAVNGKWDDVMKDVQRQKISITQAIQIIDAVEQGGLISEQVGIVKREQVLSYF